LPAALEAVPPFVPAVRLGGLPELDRRERRGVLRAQQQRHGAARRHSHREPDGDQADGPGAYGSALMSAERRKRSLMVIAVSTAHVRLRLGCRGEVLMSLT